MRIHFARARSLAKRFPDQRILVVGDLMLDRYVVGSVERISPEAPVPVIRVTRERAVPGGAANVAMNIRALGGRVTVAGVVGRDAAGRELVDILRREGIGAGGALAMSGVRTTVKTRIVAERQQVARVDWEDRLALRRPALARLCAACARLARRASGVIMDDYDKGVITQDVVDSVLREAKRRGTPVGFDPKRNHALRISGVTIVTPNCREAHDAAGEEPRSHVSDPLHDETLRRVGEALLAKWEPRELVITLGAQGMYLAARDRAPQWIPTKAREVFDVSGAGDAVIAACLLAISAGAEFREAAALGNYAAGVVVGKLGTAACGREELLEAVRADEERR